MTQTTRIDALENTIELFARVLKGLTPPPKLRLSEWAEQKRIVGGESVAPGPWHNSSVPWMVEPMDAISDPDVRRVVMMTGAQVGKTSVLMNAIGYYVECDPCPILVVQPTLDMAESFSQERLQPMIDDMPCLRDRFPPKKSRSTGNTLRKKMFPGGYLIMGGMNSTASLKSRPVRVVLFDEVDEQKEDLKGQGDPVALAIARTERFPNKKIVLTSTPTVKAKSRVEAAYNDSSRGHWCHKCPECGEWSQFLWQQKMPDGTKLYRLDFETLKMLCPHCRTLHGKTDWLRGGGKWIHEQPEHETRGYNVNGLDSLRPWAELVTQFMAAQEQAKKGIKGQLITFVNTVLAETWEDRADVAESHALQRRREFYEAELPDGAVAITMGVDTQDTRLAVLVLGWGLGFECWALHYEEFWGSPAQGDVWNRVDEMLARTWSYANGRKLKIMRTCIDSGGHMTSPVYNYCAGRTASGVVPIKGVGGDKMPIKRRAKRTQERGLYTVGVDPLKTDLLNFLRVEREGEGYMHFPMGFDGEDVFGIDARFFDMLTAERRVLKRNKTTGKPEHVWVLPSGMNNEALDAWAYARAALQFVTDAPANFLKAGHQAAVWKKPPLPPPKRMVTEDGKIIETPLAQPKRKTRMKAQPADAGIRF